MPTLPTTELEIDRAERNYVDLQPLLRYVPVIIFLHSIVWPSIILALVAFNLKSIESIRDAYVPLLYLIGSDSIFLGWLFSVVFSFVFVALLWRVSRVLGIFFLLFGIMSVFLSAVVIGGVMLYYRSTAIEDSILPIFLITPIGVLGWCLVRVGWRLTFCGADVKYLCTEKAGKLLGLESFLAAIGVPNSITSSGRHWWRGFSLFALSSLCFAVATLAALNFSQSALIHISGNVASQYFGFYFFWMLIISAIAFPVSICAAYAFRNAGRRSICASVLQVQERDQRRPILFLRAFADDQVWLGKANFWWIGRLLESASFSTLDTVLLEEGTAHGPVIALGNPDDPLPPYGAARGYFNSGDWQKGVTDMAEHAVAIVICLDDTAGIWWEVESLLPDAYWRKTLFLLHPKHGGTTTGVELIDRVHRAVPGVAFPRLQPTTKHSTPALGFFIKENGACAVARSHTFSNAAYFLTVRWFLREKLRGHAAP